jgi:D-tyrosyl-tRNA(Tyr) deacylase
MIAVIQRVSHGEVTAAEVAHHETIETGLVVLLCVESEDTDDDALWMARKIANLRVFEDEAGKFNKSIHDIGGSILLVSQFTLAGNCNKGNRPSFITAAEPILGQRLCHLVELKLQDTHGLDVRTGIFQAKMQVRLTNEGPATFILKR